MAYMSIIALSREDTAAPRTFTCSGDYLNEGENCYSHYTVQLCDESPNLIIKEGKIIHDMHIEASPFCWIVRPQDLW